jgi:hypothetical protein
MNAEQNSVAGGKNEKQKSDYIIKAKENRASD